MSSGDASSRWAAIFRARSSTSFDATWIALPAVCSEREPIVPAPRGTRSVSELTRVILSIGMPSTSLASIANAVWWPWPCDARAGEHAGGAVVVDLDRAELDVQADRRGDLDVGRHADAELLRRRRWPTLRLLGAKARRSPTPSARRRAPSRTRRSRSSAPVGVVSGNASGLDEVDPADLGRDPCRSGRRRRRAPAR